VANHVYFGMALDTSNRPYFAYVAQPSPGWLYFAFLNQSGTGFVTKDIKHLTSGEIVDYVTLAIYSDVYPIVAFYDQTTTAPFRAVHEITVGDNGLGGYTIDESSVANTEETSVYVNLALDPGENIHIATIVQHTLGIMSQGTPWTWDVIDQNQYYIEQTSLGLDRLDQAHLSYYDASKKNLKYASQNDSGGWDTYTLDTGGVGLYNSLAIAPNGSVNIAYYDQTNGDLKLIYSGLGIFGSPIAVDGGRAAGLDVGRTPSLKIDKDNLWHISYYDATNHNLKYAYYKDSSWHFSVVDNTGSGLQFSSLALDSAGYPHIAYYDANTLTMKYAYQDSSGSVWHISTLDDGSDGWPQVGVSLVALPNGLDVAYGMMTVSDTFLRYKSCVVLPLHTTCTWLPPETVAHHLMTSTYYDDQGLAVGLRLAVSSSGTPFIAYYDKHLNVATRRGGVWTSEKPDPDANHEGAQASIALDSHGKLHISYLISQFAGVRAANQNNLVFLPLTRR